MKRNRPATRASNVEQLRRDIDSGRTASKVPASDPAAVPLGADDEAAGTPPDPVIVDLARQAERQPAGDRDPVAAVGRHGPRAARRLSWALAASAAVILVAIVVGYVLSA